MQHKFTSDFLIAALAAVLSASALFLIWEGRADRGQDNATGEMLADLAARASLDGFISRNPIELGVVANRLSGVDRVAGVAVYTIENELLALSGTLEGGAQFTHPIVLDDTVLGFARVSLAPPNAAPDWMRIWFSVVAVLTVALLVAFWSQRMRTPATGSNGESPTESPPLPEPVAAWRRVLVCNLHNQLSLKRKERDRIARQALDLAERVGEIYFAESANLPGTGLVMTFPAGGGREEAFQAVCAAFLLADCVARDVPSGEFRFGLHSPEQRAGESHVDYAAAVEDAGLLAAVARPGSIVASDAILADMDEPGRLTVEPFTHPMLDELNSPDSPCHLIAGLNGDYRTLIERQARRLTET